MSIRAIANFVVRPTDVEAFISLMISVREPTEAESGCLSYALQQSVEDCSRFVFVEEWRSEQDLADHLKAPHIQAITHCLESILVSAPEVILYRIIF